MQQNWLLVRIINRMAENKLANLINFLNLNLWKITLKSPLLRC